MIIWDFSLSWLKADPVLILLLFINRCSWTSHWLEFNFVILSGCGTASRRCSEMCGEIFWLSYDLRRPLVGFRDTKYPASLRRVCSEDFLFQNASSVPFEIHCFRELESLSYITELTFCFWFETLLQSRHSQTGSPWTKSVLRSFYVASI